MKLAVAQQRTVGAIRREPLFGREHLVVPAVAVQEQVLANNLGRMFLPLEEIERSVGLWNFVPVTLGHPTRGGQPTTARDPDVVNSRAVGILFNARVEDRALKVDVFIDPEQARNVTGGDAFLAALEAGEVGEVSTGFGVGLLVQESGEHDGESFDLIARDIRPDHFAVGIERGACSVDDGCGLGINHDGPCDCEEDDVSSVDNEAVAASVFEKMKTFFSHNGSGKMEERIETLAANEGCPFDADELAEFDEARIAALEAAFAEPDETEEPDRAENEPNETEPPAWAANLVQRLDALEQAAEPALHEYRAERSELVKTLAANDRCPFDADDLEARSLDELRKLDQMATQRDYSGRGGPRRSSVSGDVDLDWEPEPVFAPAEN